MGTEILTRREITKRMIDKNISFEKMVEISGFSEEEVDKIVKIKNSYVGRFDFYLRKKYASLYHLSYGYYIKDLTLYCVGVDLDRSDFYKNKLIQNNHREFEYKYLVYGNFYKKIEEIQDQYRNNLRFKVFNNAKKYIDDYEIIFDNNYKNCDFKEVCDEDYQIYYLISKKLEDLEYERIILDLFSFDINPDDISLICEVNKDIVYEFADKNAIFFDNGQLKIYDLKNELISWKNELKIEIARRMVISPMDEDMFGVILGFSEYDFEKYSAIDCRSNTGDFELRKEILYKLSEYCISVDDVVEITGISEFDLELLCFNHYFCHYYNLCNVDFYELYYKLYHLDFYEYYLKNGDSELIWW